MTMQLHMEVSLHWDNPHNTAANECYPKDYPGYKRALGLFEETKPDVWVNAAPLMFPYSTGKWKEPVAFITVWLSKTLCTSIPLTWQRLNVACAGIQLHFKPQHLAIDMELPAAMKQQQLGQEQL